MTSNLDQLINIAVIGDIHDLWDANDEAVLKQLNVDLVLFVGDFGNESVEIVRAIAALDLPKAAIFGNHDAWYSMTDWGIKKCPYDRNQEDWVRQQMDLLGVADVGYGKLDLPALNLTVVGSRPFSWGGPKWRSANFYQERFGVTDFEASTAQIVAAASHATQETILFLGHCGPTGLGDCPEDPCGKDWHPIGGDYGDPDLAAAIAQTKSLGKVVPLVTFGHMHHRLRHTQQQRRKVVHTSPDGTLYLNAASVPRIKQTGSNRHRNFSLVSLQAGVVSQASLVWTDQAGTLTSEEVLYSRTSPVVHLA